MDEATRNALLQEAKIRLDITWDDQDTDRKVAGWIADGVSYLDGKLGGTGDYLDPGFSRTLLFEYVRYARDAALDVFENNYRNLILGMQHDRKVAAYELDSAQTTCG